MHICQCMRISKPFEPTRAEVLDLLIRDIFLDMAPSEVDARSSLYRDVTMEMFEVIGGNRNSKTLRHLFYDDELEPVFFPPEIHKLIKRRDVFLITLGRQNDAWYVIWMSGLYS